MMVWVLIMVFGTAFAGGLVALFCVTATAPLGYQDETGFHFGAPTPQRQGIVRAQTSIDGTAEGAFAVKLFDDFARQGTSVSGAC